MIRSKPDGYTLVMSSLGLAANPLLYKRLPFQPLTDLAPITQMVNAPTILVVTPSLPTNSVGELIALLKAKPGEINFATFGVGSGPHLAEKKAKAEEIRCKAIDHGIPVPDTSRATYGEKDR